MSAAVLATLKRVGIPSYFCVQLYCIFRALHAEIDFRSVTAALELHVYAREGDHVVSHVFGAHAPLSNIHPYMN